MGLPQTLDESRLFVSACQFQEAKVAPAWASCALGLDDETCVSPNPDTVEPDTATLFRILQTGGSTETDIAVVVVFTHATIRIHVKVVVLV